MMRRPLMGRRFGVFTALVVATSLTAFADITNAPPFSANAPSAALPAQYRTLTPPSIKANQFALVADDGVTVLRVDSNQSAGTVALPFDIAPNSTPVLSWRWKIDRVVERAETDKKSGDDYAARVYVFFDVPLESLSFGQRTKIRLARLLSGSDVPSAALCYVWDNKVAVGARRWSPYTDRVQIIVLQSGNGRANQWVGERPDVAADFRAAFGTAAPRITGVAIGNDTDQTGERASAWFGDVSFHAK